MSNLGPLRRCSRLLVGVVVTVIVGTSLAACGNSGMALARQACTHVDRSILLLHQATRQPTLMDGAKLGQQAYDQLRSALPIAAQAAYHDGQWQSLMTTLSESDRVPEATLVPALQAQCRVVASSIFNQPPPPSSIPAPSAP